MRGQTSRYLPTSRSYAARACRAAAFPCVRHGTYLDHTLTPSHPHTLALSKRWVADVMDLCLSCKACKSECPSNVDMAKLKAEFLHAFYEHRPRPVGHLLVKHIHRLSPLAARFAGLNNWLARRPFVRRMLESFAGLDRRRSLPELHREHLRKWFARRTPAASKGVKQHPLAGARGSPTVVLLDDCFTTFQEPQIGQAAVTLLERAGFTVELAGVCCGRAMISKGFLTDARRLAQQGIAKLERFAAAGVPLDQLALPEMVVLLGPVALVPYATPGSEELARQLAGFLPAHDAFLLENHGALTVGATLRQAALRMELIEHHARISLVVRNIGKPFSLPAGELERLLSIREKMNSEQQPYWRAS